MQTTPVTSAQFSKSVLAVPPLARNSKLAICPDNNKKIIRHIEDGGVSMLLYGGNANLYHIRTSEFGHLLDVLVEAAAEDTLVIPSVGPAYGTMMEKGRHPSLVLYLDVPFSLVDVNVHPAKTEVRFHDTNSIFRSVYHAIADQLAIAPWL